MTWMKHVETGNLADLPDLPYWRGAGWEPTDERPDDPDTLRDPLPHAEPETTEAPAETPGLSAAETEKPATTAKTKKETGRG